MHKRSPELVSIVAVLSILAVSAGSATADPGDANTPAAQATTSEGGVIEVHVKDSTGKPIEDARVSVHDLRNQRSLYATTDSNGLASIRGEAGDYLLLGAGKQGYVQQTEQQQTTIQDGQTTQIECILKAAPKVAGIVRDQAGTPLAGVELRVMPFGPNETRSDESGRFEIAENSMNSMPVGLPNMTRVLVARDVDRSLAKVVDIDEQADSLDIKLEPAVTVTGKVLDHEGKPLPGARVRVALHADRWRAAVGRDNVFADSNGVFEAGTIPAGRQYTISASASGYGQCSIPFDTFDLKGNRYDAGTFKLVLADSSVTGIVVDLNGDPVPGADVRAYGEGQPDQLQLRPVQSDSEGKFTIEGLCPGSIQLSAIVRGETRLQGSAQVESGATDIKIVVSERSTASRFVSRKPATLKGKPLVSLKDLGIDLPPDAEGKMLLVCFWDMGQRPSRYCVTQLASRAAQLGEKGVIVAAVQATKVEDSVLNQWVEENKVPFQVGRIAGDVDKTQFAWGVGALPHLILTDKTHVVVAEGFSLSDLDKQIEAAIGR